MSGHSKWHSIKHKKGAADAARGKLFARLIRQIEVAAREGGGDADANATLRTMVQKARDSSVPIDTIERASAVAIRRSFMNAPRPTFTSSTTACAPAAIFFDMMLEAMSGIEGTVPVASRNDLPSASTKRWRRCARMARRGSAESRRSLKMVRSISG